MVKYAQATGDVRRGGALCSRSPASSIWRPERRQLAQVRAAEADRWVSLVAAAEIIGCHPSTALRLVQRGVITQRPVDGPVASLDMKSVEEVAARWNAPGASRRGRRPREEI